MWCCLNVHYAIFSSVSVYGVCASHLKNLSSQIRRFRSNFKYFYFDYWRNKLRADAIISLAILYSIEYFLFAPIHFNGPIAIVWHMSIVKMDCFFRDYYYLQTKSDQKSVSCLCSNTWIGKWTFRYGHFR